MILVNLLSLYLTVTVIIAIVNMVENSISNKSFVVPVLQTHPDTLQKGDDPEKGGTILWGGFDAFETDLHQHASHSTAWEVIEKLR